MLPISVLLLFAVLVGVVVLLVLDIAKIIRLTRVGAVAAAIAALPLLLPGLVCLYALGGLTVDWSILPMLGVTCLLAILSLYILIKGFAAPIRKGRNLPPEEKQRLRLHAAKRVLGYALYANVLYLLLLTAVLIPLDAWMHGSVSLTGMLEAMGTLLLSPLLSGGLTILSAGWLIVGLPVLPFAIIAFVISCLIVLHLAAALIITLTYGIVGVVRAGTAAVRVGKWTPLYIVLLFVPLVNILALILALAATVREVRRANAAAAQQQAYSPL